MSIAKPGAKLVEAPMHAYLTGVTGRTTPPPDGPGNGFGDFHDLADKFCPGIILRGYNGSWAVAGLDRACSSAIGALRRADASPDDAMGLVHMASRFKAEWPKEALLPPENPDIEKMSPSAYIAWAKQICLARPTIHIWVSEMKP